MKKILSMLVIICMLITMSAMFVPFGVYGTDENEEDAGGEIESTTTEKAMSYSMGKLQKDNGDSTKDSYEGYGYFEDFSGMEGTNATALAGQLSAKNLTHSNGSISAGTATGGKPEITGAPNGQLTFAPPSIDREGNAYAGLQEGARYYTILKFSVHGTGNAATSSSAEGNGGHNALLFGGPDIRITQGSLLTVTRSANTSDYANTPQTVSALTIPDVNDVLVYKGLRTCSTSPRHLYTVWLENVTKNQSALVYNREYNRWGSGTGAANANSRIGTTVSTAKNRFHSAGVYEEYEYLFRETIKEVESFGTGGLKGANLSFDSVTTDLNLQTEAVRLDAGDSGDNAGSGAVAREGSVEWYSDNEDVINPVTGVVVRQSEDIDVVLTGVYKIKNSNGEDSGKQKIINYYITVLGLRSAQEEINEAAEMLLDIVDGYPDSRTENFTLPTYITTSYGTDVEVDWEVKLGVSNADVDSDGNVTVTRSVDEDVNVRITATLLYGNGSPKKVHYTFIVPRMLTVKDGDDYITTFDRRVDYSNGILKKSSYVGYVYVDYMNYADKTAFTAAGHEVPGSTAALTYNANGPLVYKKTGAATAGVVLVTPAKDSNDVPRPNGATYTELDYSLSTASQALMYISIPFRPANGAAQIQNGTTGSGSTAVGIRYKAKSSSSDTYANTETNFYSDNDRISARVLQLLTGSKETSFMWGWIWNETKGQKRDAVNPLLSEGTPAYGAGATTVEAIQIDGGNSSAILNNSLSLYSLKVIEQYEMLFRDLIGSVEMNMLSEKDNDLSNVKRNLTLPAEITGLDLGKTANIIWDVSGHANINSDGTVIPPTGEPVTGTITGSYTIDGKIKTIEYTVTVKEYTDADAIVDAKDIINKQIDSFVAANDGINLTEISELPALIETIPVHHGKIVTASWSVVGLNGGANINISDDTHGTVSITQSKKKNVDIIITANLSCNGVTDLSEYPFVIMRNADESKEFAEVIDAVLLGTQVTADLNIYLDSEKFGGVQLSVVASTIAALYDNDERFKGVWYGDFAGIQIEQTDIDHDTMLEKVFPVTIDLTGAYVEADDVVKLFIWDSVDGMKPFLAPVTVNHQ